MIPIRLSKQTVNDFKTKLLDFIKEKDGDRQITMLNLVMNKIQPSMTFEDLIVADCNTLQNLKLKYNSYKNTLNARKLKNPIRTLSILIDYYTSFSHSYGPTLMKNLKIEVCPYCNRNYIFNAGDRRTSEFDHFIPKNNEKYPIFAVSVYNLVPVCHTCNHIKSTKITKLINPYDARLKISTFKFNPIVKTISNFDLELVSTNPLEQDAADSLNNDLKLKELYSHHSYLVKDLYQKTQIYQTGYLASLKQLFFSNPSLSNVSQSDFVRLILGTYGDDKDISKYPLSKATKDISIALGLYQRL